MNAEARQIALKILERRDVSRKMLLKKLAEKGVSDADAEEVADWLCGLNVVNDSRYAGLVARHYAAKGYGERRIREQLYQRGIDRELWDEAIESLDHLDDTAYRLFTNKLRGDNTPDGIQRAQMYLLRRGFSWDETREVTERYLSGKDTP